jgi:3-phenylpropionate/trans-cinnamate dioxygenase ferredoxin component
MVATLELTPEERRPFGFLLCMEAGRLRHGTKEHQDIGRGLESILTGVMNAPEGPVEIEFANDEIYMLGVRNHADASELEEYWLDNKASKRQRGQPAPFPEDAIAAAVQRFYPEVLNDPESFDFNPWRPVFQTLGYKIDTALTTGAPRVRAIYQKERNEIIRRTREMQESRRTERGRLYPRGVEIEAWRRVIRADMLGPGEMTGVDVAGVKLLIANVAGEYYAIDNVCTHQPQLSNIRGLDQGELSTADACVTCPWHGARFSLKTGDVVRQPYAAEFNKAHFFAGRLPSLVDPMRSAKDLRTYSVRIEDEWLWVNVV